MKLSLSLKVNTLALIPSIFFIFSSLNYIEVTNNDFLHAKCFLAN